MKHICRIVTAIIIVLTLFITYKINNISTESVQANGSLTIDGEPSKAYFTEHIEYSFEHTSGSGENRLLLVGVSWGRTTTGPLSRKIEKITISPIFRTLV